MNKHELERLIGIVLYDLTNNGGCNLGAGRFSDWCGLIYALDRLGVAHPYRDWLNDTTKLLNDDYVPKARCNKMIEVMRDLAQLVQEALPHRRGLAGAGR